jgi:hypothetical protein
MGLSRSLAAVGAALLLGTTMGVVVAPRASTAPADDDSLRRAQAKLLDPQATHGREMPTGPHAHHHPRTDAQLAAAAPLDPATGGAWSYGTAFAGGFNAIHTVAGPGGKILLVAGSGNQTANFAAGTFRTFLWDTVAGTRREIATPADMFCAGHVLLPDGRALVGGGTTSYSPFRGLRRLYAFNFDLERYERLTDMQVGRWYPSLVNDWLGRTLILGGFDESGATTRVAERFDYRTDSLAVLASRRVFGLYPPVFLASGQRFFVAKRSDGDPPGFWNPGAVDGHRAVPGFTNGSQREGSASCFVGDVRDQRLITMGGGWPATTSTNIIKLNAATPTYAPGPPLRAAKAYVSCVNLPDGTLLEAHGGSANRVSGASDEVSALNPARTAWIPLNPLPAGEHRLYHSMLFVLDDGRVASLSSNPVDGTAQWSSSLLMYSPPYLFKGTRPTFTQVPAQVRYGGSYPVAATTPGSTFTRVTVTTPPSPTHSVEPNQRYLSLPVVNGRITVPSAPSLLPPGKYRLWAVNARGVPSVASWVTLS